MQYFNKNEELFKINGVLDEFILCKEEKEKLEEENEELKNQISELQKTINILVEERRIIAPLYYGEIYRDSTTEITSIKEMPDWFKKGFEG